MRFLTARGFALVALVPVLFLFSAVPGCSNESEGERCGDDTGPNSDDCSSGLTCTLISRQGNVYRCCNPNPNIVNDSRCVVSNASAVGGSGGTGDSGTSASGAGDSGGTTSGGSGGATSSAGASDVPAAGAGGS